MNRRRKVAQKHVSDWLPARADRVARTPPHPPCRRAGGLLACWEWRTTAQSSFSVSFPQPTSCLQFRISAPFEERLETHQVQHLARAQNVRLPLPNHSSAADVDSATTFSFGPARTKVIAASPQLVKGHRDNQHGRVHTPPSFIPSFIPG